MNEADGSRRALLAGLGGVVAGTMLAMPGRAASPRLAEHQAILDKIARTSEGFGECCLPVQAFPGTGDVAFRLDQAGSYYLNGNVVAAAGQTGIEIAADNVDLDLNGYSVIGQGGGAGLPGGTGIRAIGLNICVYDGSVVRFDDAVDFGGASHSIVWDVTALEPARNGFVCGAFNQHYDTEVHRCLAGTAYLALGASSELRECGAYACLVGFQVHGERNLVLSNSATDCPTPFDIAPGNAWGPIVMALGDLSLVPHGSDVNANLVY